MALGPTHTAINFLVLSSTFPLAITYASLKPSFVGVAMFAACWGSLFLSPDLDLKQSNSTRMWGPLSWIWSLYSRFFSHRKISHNIFLGTASRIIYLATCLGLLAAIVLIAFCFIRLLFYEEARFLTSLSGSFSMSRLLLAHLVSDYYHYLISAFFGLFVADFIHIFVDEISTWWKRLRKLF